MTQSTSVGTSTGRTGDRAAAQRLKVAIRGAVQGVGFRPFIYRLAAEMSLQGWVLNSASGVFLEVEGAPEALHGFLLRIEREKPPISFIQSLESTFLDPIGYTGFEIRASLQGEKTALVLPDVATCPDCLRDILSPQNRRFRYPFTNCTNCGPRFTIIESLPYDRPATSMKHFAMCPACLAEYEDPRDRRFHAQPNACPDCGPHLELWDTQGFALCTHDDALRQAAEYVRRGEIVAVKGLGGFHLICDARNQDAVRMLRVRKHREAKPFALMYPSLAMIERDCEVGEVEARVLRSSESPIVILRTQPGTGIRIAPAVAPSNPYLGVMLPYTPLHHLLMNELGFPVVATSANLSDEPICIDQHEAAERLRGVADTFLIHNRPILRHVDDSIVRVVLGRELVLRRARGFAPLPVLVDRELPPTLSVGAHQKNTIAAAVGKQVFVSQHIGDLETGQAFGAFERVIESFRTLYELKPGQIACDLHPNYMSSQYARRQASEPVGVQHHYAHVLSCMAENSVAAPALGISWDGSGYGPDRTIWGGEFLRVTETGYERFAHLRTFRLPGSEKAVREPRRCAAGMLFEMFGEDIFTGRSSLNGAVATLASIEAFTTEERSVVNTMLARGLNSPVTSSAGRVFDAVAALIGIRQFARFEGQAAMELEFAASQDRTADTYTIGGPCKPAVDLHGENDTAVIDWAPMVTEIITDLGARVPQTRIARKFHNTLVKAMVLVAEACGEERVVLSGGCFQNKLLTELAVERLEQRGFRVYWHQRIPPNDGGIALGQIMAAARAARTNQSSGGKEPA